MGQLAMKGLCQKHGLIYYRRKVSGKDVYLRLPGLDDPDFARAYAEAACTKERARPAEGTLAALVAAYRASPEFNQIGSQKTKANYSYYLDMIVEKDGHRTVKGVRPAHVYILRDRMQETPGKANNWLTVFKNLMIFAAKKDWRADNPAIGVEALKIGEWEPWPAHVLEKALAAASETTRLMIMLGLCTGARVGDAIRLQHNWIKDGVLEYTASKNRKDVAVPVHPLLVDEIAKVERKAVTILYNRYGRPFTDPKAIEERIRDLMQKIGETEKQYVFHGLRKNAACYLYEMGLTEEQIGTILAMTPDTVRHYTKKKRSLMIARGVADKVRGGRILQLRGENISPKGGNAK